MTRVQDVYPDDRVSLREVGLRDGLQLVKNFPSTAAKQRWMREEYGAGVRHFEVGSFLPAIDISAIRRCPRDRQDGGLASRRARHCAGAQRARRQRGAGLGRRRNRHGGLGHRRAQPGQCETVARAGHRQRQAAVRVCATPVRTSRSSTPRSRWRWAVRSRARSIRGK